MITGKVQKAIDQWNQKYPVGTAVRLSNSLGVATYTETISPAMLFAKTEAVIFVRGRIGFFNLNRVVVESIPLTTPINQEQKLK